MSQQSIIRSLSLSAALLFTSLAQGQPTTATAPAPTNENIEAARTHFRQGLKLYDLGRFLEAAHEYELAFESKDDAVMLFNIGQAYRFAGENAKALGAYRAYLRRDPKTHRRADIEARIADLQKLVTAEHESKKAPPGVGIISGDDKDAADKPAHQDVHGDEPKVEKIVEVAPRKEPIPETEGNRRRRFAGIGLMAGGGAAIIAGAAVTGLAYSFQSSESHPAAGTAFDPNAPAKLRAEQISGGVVLGVGAGALAAGAIMYVLASRQQHRERLVVAPLVGRGVAGLSLTGVLR